MPHPRPQRPNKSPHFKRGRTIPELIADDRRKRPMADTAYYKIGENEPREIAFLNNWGNAASATNSVAPLRFYLSDDGEVRMHGHITGGGVGTIICTLPAEIRPQFAETFICPLSEGEGHATIRVDANGDVTLVNIV